MIWVWFAETGTHTCRPWALRTRVIPWWRQSPSADMKTQASCSAWHQLAQHLHMTRCMLQPRVVDISSAEAHFSPKFPSARSSLSHRSCCADPHDTSCSPTPRHPNVYKASKRNISTWGGSAGAADVQQQQLLCKSGTQPVQCCTRNVVVYKTWCFKRFYVIKEDYLCIETGQVAWYFIKIGVFCM